jgi:hypothetical protein
LSAEDENVVYGLEVGQFSGLLGMS